MFKSFLNSPWQALAAEVGLFLLTLAGTLLTVWRLAQLRARFDLTASASPQVTLSQLLVMFVLATAFILLLLFVFKKRARLRGGLLRAIFLLAIVMGILLAGSLWLADWLALLLLAGLLWWWKKPSAFSHDLLIIIAAVGLVAQLAKALQPLTVIGFMLVLAVYDFVAVYKTKHMVKMAKNMIAAKALFGLIIPTRFKLFFKPLVQGQLSSEYLLLGGGDLVLPLLLVASLIPGYGLLAASVVGLFALIGLAVSFVLFINQPERAAIPALPPIVFFSLLGYLLILLV